MNKIKKSLSVLLSLVMLFTTLCFFVLPETGIKANAAAGDAVSVAGKTDAYNRVDDVIITVPETIYMNPANTKNGQYYVNNTIKDGAVTLDKVNNATTGKLYVYAPGATSVKYNVVSAVGSAGEPTVTEENTLVTFTADNFKSDTYSKDITLTVASGLAAKDVASVKWEITLTFSDGKTATYYAYTTLYCPHYSVGAVAEAKYSDQWNDASAWISGITGVSTSKSPIGKTSNNSSASGIFNPEPLYDLTKMPTGGQKNAKDVIKDSDNEINYVYSSAVDGNKSSHAQSYLGYINVDSSRYTKTSQLPNFYVGSDITASGEKWNLYYAIKEYYSCYTLGDSNAYTTSPDDGEKPSGWTQLASASDKGTGYTDRTYVTPDYDVSTINNKYIHIVNHTKVQNAGARYANCYTSAQFIVVDKSELRNLVLQASSINESNYSNGWGWYIQGFENAAYVLGNPCASQTDVDNAVSRLKTTRDGGTDNTPDGLGAVTGLQKLVKFYNKDGSNNWYEDAYVTVGAAVNAEVTPDAVSRTGYTLRGWSQTAGGEPMSPAKIDIYTASPKLYAVWEANKYVLTFDNYFDFDAWKNAGISAERGEISDVTLTGFTITATASGTNDAYTSWTPWVAVQPNTTYRFEADLDFDNSVGRGSNEIFVHMKNANGEVDTDYLREDGTVNGTEYYNSSGKKYVQFTTSADTATVSFRFDVNNYGNILRVDKIRLIRVDDGISYVPTQVVTYDGTYDLATPTRPAYAFAGWRDSNNITYTSGSTVAITENKALYSSWTPITYTITLRDGITGEETVQSYTVESTSFNLPSAEEMQKESYTFTGWEITSAPESNWPATGTKVTDGTLDKRFGNVTITAKYDEIYYTIKWVSDGKVVKEEQVRYGAIPQKPATDPTKESTIQHNYTFAGWGEEIVAAYEDKTYTAQYTEALNNYNVTWKTETDTYTKSYPYGTTNYKFEYEEPTKAQDAQYTYTFAGWKIEGDESGTIYDIGRFPELTGNITFVAYFEPQIRTYNVTWMDHNDRVLEIQEIEYGASIVPIAAPDRSGESEMYDITFVGWEDLSSHEIITDFTGITVTGDATYQATYDSAKKTYQVIFHYKNANGEDKTYSVVVDHGTPYSDIVLPHEGDEASNEEDWYAEYYYTETEVGFEAVGEAFYHNHFKAEWGTTPETITSSQEFTAIYSEIENVGMSSVVYKLPTCFVAGENTQQCSNCGYTHTESKPAPGDHKMEPYSDSATCLVDGTKVYKCVNENVDCNYSRTEDSDRKGHTFKTVSEGRPASCLDDGEYAYNYCERCFLYFYATDTDIYSANGKETADFTIPATGHEYDSGVTTKAPTCTAVGEMTYTCINVNCLSGGQKHSYTEKISMLSHEFTNHVAAVAPDCFNAGNSAYKYCAKCNSYFAEEDNDVHSDAGKPSADAFNLPKEEHKEGNPVQENIQASDCVTAAEYDNVYYCVKCEALGRTTKLRTVHVTGQPLGHMFDKVVIDAAHLKAAATCNSLAVYYYECSRQGCNQIAKPGENTNSFVYEAVFEYTEGGYDYTNHATTQTTLVNEKTATCKEEGYTGDLICNACERVVKEGSAIEKNPKNHADYETTVTSVTTQEATCILEEKWTETTRCTGCNEVIKTEEKTGPKNALKHKGETTETKTITAEATCCSVEVYRIDTVCLDCNNTVSSKTGTGGYNTNNHIATYTNDENFVTATCIIPRSYDKVTYCSGCYEKLGTEKITLNVDSNNHKGETRTAEENVSPATCTKVRTWNEVVYCADCNKAISSTPKTGTTDPDAHTREKELRGEKEATCKEDGYTGDLYWVCCDTLHSEGSVIPKHNNHTPGEAVRENEIAATETTDGQYDIVVYCTVCEGEISRETIVFQIERTITFVLKDKTVVVKAYRGDKVTPPETPEVISADGFYHLFIHWDKTIKPVTGDATYTAIYTEPCNYSELDRLEGVLNEIMDGELADPALVALFKEDIDAAFKAIDEVNKERRFRDVSEQYEITEVTDMLEELVVTICPDYGATLAIEASSVLYTGRVLDIKAVKMPSGNVINDADWASSDEEIAFVANGKLYAIGVGTVTITATRGKLKATKVITVIEGGNTRGVNFTALESIEFIIEDCYAVTDSAIIYWTDDQPLRFRVNLTQAGLFDYYIVYINGSPAEMSKDGYYVIPAGYGDARVTVIGESENDYSNPGSGTTAVSKWSFWEWILSFFRKIGDFFGGLFG